MKIKFIKIILMILFFTTMNLWATDVNGRFVVLTNDGTNYVVKVQINTNTGTDDMGGATIIFNFNESDLSIPTDADGTTVSSSAYTYHNFSGGNYSDATITKPKSNQLWLNIELTSDNNGTVVAQTPNWTDVVTISFTTLDANGNAGLTWQTSSSFWSIYDGDNTTKWVTGTFTDEDTSPLPVELQSFKATNQKGSSVELEWATATEVNNYGFEIERKVVKAADASTTLSMTEDFIPSEVEGWEKVGFVKGAGNSNSEKLYSFVDKNPVGGTTFAYRLKQIDIDGTYKYSDEIEVKVLPTKYDLYQNYPNPFNPTTKIKFSLPENAKVKIAVYDILGRELTTLINKNIEAGYHSINFDASQFTSGVYLYTIETSKFTKVKKMLLIK